MQNICVRNLGSMYDSYQLQQFIVSQIYLCKENPIANFSNHYSFHIAPTATVNTIRPRA